MSVPLSISGLIRRTIGEGISDADLLELRAFYATWELQRRIEDLRKARLALENYR